MVTGSDLTVTRWSCADAQGEASGADGAPEEIFTLGLPFIHFPERLPMLERC
jgi:hypothetical protein